MVRDVVHQVYNDRSNRRTFLFSIQKVQDFCGGSVVKLWLNYNEIVVVLESLQESWQFA